MGSSKILVAIPVYNCENQIGRVIKDFDEKLIARLEKIIIIDNLSTDNTVVEAKKAIKKNGSSKIEIWQNKSNYNLGGTHKVAFINGENMKMNYVAILHGDNQAKTQELHRLIDIAEGKPELGAILGCRFMEGSVLNGYSWQRILGNRFINFIYSIVTLRRSLDLGSGLNLFKLEDLSDHRYLGFGDNITFNIDLLLDYYKKKTPLQFVPITWSEEGQVSNARNLNVGTTALIKLFNWRFNRIKLANRKASYYMSEKI
jgi:glycosyltransferase involved in cell wall biosynthesis